jgi:hypothetical protein
MDKTKITICEKCGTKLRIPINNQIAKIRCGNPECRHIFQIKSNNKRKQKFFRTLKYIGTYILGMAFFAALIYFSADTTTYPPDNTIVFVDRKSKTYFAPPLIPEDKRNFLIETRYPFAAENNTLPASKEIAKDLDVIFDNKIIYVDMEKNIYFTSPQKNYIELYPDRLSNITNKGFSPDKLHRDMAGFIDEIRFIDKILSLIGKRKSRWTDDGSWNW